MSILRMLVSGKHVCHVSGAQHGMVRPPRRTNRLSSNCTVHCSLFTVHCSLFTIHCTYFQGSYAPLSFRQVRSAAAHVESGEHIVFAG